MPIEKSAPKVELQRDGVDRLLPKDFFEILMRRYFPVLGLTYASSVIGIAAHRGPLVHYIFEDRSAYVMALLVALWVSIPAVFWMMLRNSYLYHQYADQWYKIVAAIMIVLMLMSYILFPEINLLGLRLYFVASIPTLLIMYLLLVKGGLPAGAAHTLSALGLAFLIYGAAINFLY